MREAGANFVRIISGKMEAEMDRIMDETRDSPPKVSFPIQASGFCMEGTLDI